MTLYDWLLLFHILAAITWIGGAITMNALGTRITRSGDGREIVAFMAYIEWIGNLLYLPSALVLLGLGTWMVAISEAWAIGQLWIILVLVGIGVTIVTGLAFFGPQSKRISRAIGSHGPDSSEARFGIRRLLLVARLDLLVLLLVVADMVLKPGL